MNIKIEPIKKQDKEILRNLLEKYHYEFSQYNDMDVNQFGLYDYDYLDCYWTEENRYPFFIKVDDKLAGFMMVNDYQEVPLGTDYTLAEFFVMYKYRGKGVGRHSVKYLFDNFSGKWHLCYHPKNEISKLFWHNVVGDYTSGKYELLTDIKELLYEDGVIRHVLRFDTKKRN